MLGKLHHRGLAAGVALVCLASAGCLQVPFCIPELSYAPAIDPKCPSSEVYAFRVDITQKVDNGMGLDSRRGETVDYECLTRLQPTSQGTTSPQLGIACAYGWRNVGLVNSTVSNTGHGLGLRFYRPGYDTIVLKPGEVPKELVWLEATELAAQAKAVDDLLGDFAVQSTRKATYRHTLEPGTISSAHRQALLFGAAEYDRLAQYAATDDKELQTRLLEKSARLKAWADGK